MVCTLLGTGTSHGIPVIGCDCRVCTSRDPHDTRFRTSAYFQSTQHDSILIDTGPDFRQQALSAHITAIDAVLITHGHADHIHGLDDIRIFSLLHPRFTARQMNERTPLPFYANEAAIRDIQSRFSYIFKPATEGGGKPYVRLIPCERFTPEYPLCIGGVEVVHIPLQHGSLAVAGWVLSEYRSDAKGGTAKSDASPAATKHSIAYLTDCNAISDTSIDCIRRASGVLEHVVLDGLRESTHSTHFSFDEAFECAQKIGAAHTWITHICHDKNHEEITAYFEKKMEAAQHDALQNGHRNAHCTQVCPAYDGLKLNV